MGTKSPFLDPRTRFFSFCLQAQGRLRPGWGGVPSPEPSSQGGYCGSMTPTSALRITCCELLKTKPRDHTGQPREGLAFLGWELQIRRLGGSAVPAPEGEQASWLPCFPGELASCVTPSLTKKSSLPKISRAAGKWKKGQNGIGAWYKPART